MIRRVVSSALMFVGGCADDGGAMMDATTADGSTSAMVGSSSESSTGDTSTSMSSGSTGDPGSTGLDGTDSTGLEPTGVLAVGTFTIPSGATVEEFSFTAPLLSGPSLLSGEQVVVAVRDLTHPRRDQTVLCTNNHPLDGCATVDYGAFGMTHDNRISFEGPDGPWAIHLYKDRSLQVRPEPLPVNE